MSTTQLQSKKALFQYSDDIEILVKKEDENSFHICINSPEELEKLETKEKEDREQTVLSYNRETNSYDELKLYITTTQETIDILDSDDIGFLTFLQSFLPPKYLKNNNRMVRLIGNVYIPDDLKKDETVDNKVCQVDRGFLVPHKNGDELNLLEILMHQYNDDAFAEGETNFICPVYQDIEHGQMLKHIILTSKQHFLIFDVNENITMNRRFTFLSKQKCDNERRQKPFYEALQNIYRQLMRETPSTELMDHIYNKLEIADQEDVLTLCLPISYFIDIFINDEYEQEERREKLSEARNFFVKFKEEFYK
jgi:hypothetical protein